MDRLRPPRAVKASPVAGALSGSEDETPLSPKSPNSRLPFQIFRPLSRFPGADTAVPAEKANESQDCIPRKGSQLVFAHSHAHSQWRTIAESFSSLLSGDFVDIVFKVRGRPGVLGAHRALVAAAWPVLRDGLSRLDLPPPKEVREAGLQWISTSANVEGQEVPAKAALVDGSGAQVAFTDGSSNQAVAANCPGRGNARTGSEREVDLDNCPGVLDVSSQSWGSYSLVRAMLCHLYSRPVAISERELPNLRAAALHLGSTELAKCCDDADRRPLSRPAPREFAPAAPSTRPTTPEPDGNGTGHAGNDRRSCAGPAHTSSFEGCSASTSVASINVPASEDTSASREASIPPKVSDISPKVPVQGPGQALEGSPTTEWAVRVTSRSSAAPNTEGSEGRMRAGAVAAKAWGERCHSFDKACAGDKPNSEGASADGKQPPEKGGVRRVLSEIKRNMVESSRIIADKTFQQMYEMVPGERGILGEGINGPVRMARHRKTGREVAVKRISCVNLSEQRRQMLVSEVRIFLQVSHRNIVQLLEVYESEVDQAVLLVMELCTGGELFERLATRRWYSEFDAARVAKEMLDAIAYLHSQNICHRDLKLENWLYESPSSEAKLKLCDFGFGQIVEPSVQLTATLGSLFYVAPEVLEGSYGLPCDMWSVGVIVYMLLSGMPPFDGKTDGDVTAKIKQGRFVSTGKRWEGISEPAKHFVRCMLRKDPYERLTAVEAAQHAWLKMECQVKPPYSWPKGSPDVELELPIDRGVIRDMWKFAQNNAITRAALGMLAKLNTSSFGGREEDVVLLEQRFRVHDEQNTGKIDAEQFIQVLKELLHLQISSAEEKQFFTRIAESAPPSEDAGNAPEQKVRRRREVNYSEFIALTKARRMANNTAAIREAFRAMDVAGDGYIQQADMHRVLGDEFKSTIENYVDENGKEDIDYVHFASIVSLEISKKETPVEPLALLEKGGVEKSSSVPPKETEAAGQAPPQSGEAAQTGGVASGLPAAEALSRLTTGEPEQEGREASEQPEQQPPQPQPQPPQQSQQQQQMLREKSSDAKDRKDSIGSGNGEDAAPVQEEKAEESDEERDEELDADAASDEEQLVNVKKENTMNEAEVEREAEKPKMQPPPKDSKTSFSLSLAGSSEYDDVVGVNRVISLPSDAYSIRQLPGFHSRTLRPFYAARPVSNVVMGLIRGTSLYAKQSVAAKLATIIHTTCGWFFIMPNPKYHTEVDTRKGLLSKETGKFRFVAWWIHPRFVPQLRQWFERLTYEGLDQERQEQRREARAQHEARAQQQQKAGDSGGNAMGRREPLERGPAAAGGEDTSSAGNGAGGGGAGAGGGAATGSTDPGVETVAPQRRPDVQKMAPNQFEPEGDMGSPGDFRFSDVPKPESYLHTYRDLHTREHVNMLTQLNDGTHRFLRSLFDENFMAHATISAGFHYPVRTQYATLHMQLRVNSGSVCGDDGRGIEVNSLIETLKRDHRAYERDNDTLKYHVTENVKVSLLAAAEEYEEKNPGESAKRHITPLLFELGVTAMPTIHDEGEEEEDGEATDESRRSSKVHQRPLSSVSPADAASASAGGDLAGEVGEAEAMCAGVTPQGGDPVGEAPASYLVNLQPSPNSKFCKVIYERRTECAKIFGADPSYLYPLHVSVTGFFEAYPSQVKALAEAMKQELHKEMEDSTKVAVGKVICTKTGYVLFDLQAKAVTAIAQRLGERSSRELGVHIRPKAVNHISLACNRPEEEAREKIKAIYEPHEDEPGGAEILEAYATASFDLVLSRLIVRSSFERMAEDGPHKFAEVMRLPVQGPLHK